MSPEQSRTIIIPNAPLGGVLTERKVREVLPALENQVTGLANVMTSPERQMNIKAKDITNYREKHQL